MSGPRFGSLDDASAVAHMHATRIHSGFLVQLGRPFLHRLYRRAVRSPHALVLVIDDDEGVTGFVAATEDTNAFYREFLLHDGVLATVAALPHIVRSLRSVLETLRYGLRSNDGGPKAEILAIAVREGLSRRGAGTELVKTALHELSGRGVASVRVVTVLDNAAAVRMYERAGFRRYGTKYVHRDVAQAVLVWP